MFPQDLQDLHVVGISLIAYFLLVSTAGAVALRIACWLHNSIMSRGVPSWRIAEPAFSKAMFIAFVVALPISGVGAFWKVSSAANAAAVLATVSLLSIFVAVRWKLSVSIKNAVSVTFLTAVVGAAMVTVLVLTFSIVRFACY